MRRLSDHHHLELDRSLLRDWGRASHIPTSDMLLRPVSTPLLQFTSGILYEPSKDPGSSIQCTREEIVAWIRCHDPQRSSPAYTHVPEQKENPAFLTFFSPLPWMEITLEIEKIRLKSTNILSRFRTRCSYTVGARCKSPKLLLEQPHSLHYLEACREPLKAERLMIDPIRAETQSMRKCLVSPSAHRVGGKTARSKNKVRKQAMGCRSQSTRDPAFCIT